jgi:hypothetical protein
MMWLVVGLMACGGGDDDMAIAEEIWEEIQGWESWDEKAPWTGIQPSADGTHGSHVRITFNEAAAGAWGEDALPFGSVSVKRGYDSADDSAPRNFVTVMKKIEGYDPDNGDWFWLRIGDDGTPSDTEIGQAAFCSGCHSVGTDYLRTVTDVPPS